MQQYPPSDGLVKPGPKITLNGISATRAKTPKRRPCGKLAISDLRALAALLCDTPPPYDEAIGWIQVRHGAWLRTDEDLAVA